MFFLFPRSIELNNSESNLAPFWLDDSGETKHIITLSVQVLSSLLQ